MPISAFFGWAPEAAVFDTRSIPFHYSPFFTWRDKLLDMSKLTSKLFISFLTKLENQDRSYYTTGRLLLVYWFKIKINLLFDYNK